SFGLIERKEVASVCYRFHFCTRDRLYRALPLVLAGPVLVAIDHQHRGRNLAVALPRLIPQIGMAKQVDEGAVVAWPKPRSMDLRTEAGCNCHEIDHTTLEDTLLEEWVAQTHDGLPEHWHPREVEGEPSQAIRRSEEHTSALHSRA